MKWISFIALCITAVFSGEKSSTSPKNELALSDNKELQNSSQSENQKIDPKKFENNSEKTLSKMESAVGVPPHTMGKTVDVQPQVTIKSLSKLNTEMHQVPSQDKEEGKKVLPTQTVPKKNEVE